MLKIGQILTAEKITHEWFDFYFKATEQREVRYVCECQRISIKNAEKAISTGDTVAMLAAYGDLETYEI